MKVYRVEAPVRVSRYDEEDRWYGPFCAGIYSDDPEMKRVCDLYRLQLSGPILEPEEDNPSREWYRGAYSGMLNYSQGHTWLPMRGLWNRMVSCGFRLAEYEVAPEHIGSCDTQIFWWKENATFVRELTIEEFRDEYMDDKQAISVPTEQLKQPEVYTFKNRQVSPEFAKRWNGMACRNRAKSVRKVFMMGARKLPKPNQECCCGSGKKFKKCCGGLLTLSLADLQLFAKRNKIDISKFTDGVPDNLM